MSMEKKAPFMITQAWPEDAAALLDYLKCIGGETDNLRAIRLYEKFGFRKLCTFPAFFKLNGQYIDFDLMNRDMR